MKQHSNVYKTRKHTVQLMPFMGHLITELRQVQRQTSIWRWTALNPSDSLKLKLISHDKTTDFSRLQMPQNDHYPVSARLVIKLPELFVSSNVSYTNPDLTLLDRFRLWNGLSTRRVTSPTHYMFASFDTLCPGRKTSHGRDVMMIPLPNISPTFTFTNVNSDYPTLCTIPELQPVNLVTERRH